MCGQYELRQGELARFQDQGGKKNKKKKCREEMVCLRWNSAVTTQSGSTFSSSLLSRILDQFVIGELFLSLFLSSLITIPHSFVREAK